MIYHSVDYAKGTWGTFDDLPEAVMEAVRAVEPHLSEFDVIAVQGTSGMCIGFPLSLKIDKPIVVVRKPDEDSHGCRGEVINAGALKVGRRNARCLFVDDFVSTGGTRSRVREAVEAKGAKVVAQFMSRDGYTTL